MTSDLRDRLQSALGDTNGAFQWLASAVALRDLMLTENSVDPIWDAVRADPRFAQLRARMGLP